MPTSELHMNHPINNSENKWIATWCLVAIYFCGWLAWRSGLQLEIDRNEAWNAWHTLNAFNPKDLYPSKSDLIVNNYPPLSFLFLKALSLGHDPVVFGRIVSILSVLAIGWCAGAIVKMFGATAVVATITSLWCIAIFAGLFPGYVGMNDPNLLALAVMMAGVASFIRQSLRSQTAYGACAIMVVALFFKHSIIVFPAAVLLWQFGRDKQSAIRHLFFMSALGGAGVLICFLIFGDAFFQQLVFPRKMRLSSAARFFRKTPPLIPGLVMWWLWRRTATDNPAAKFTTILLPISLLLNLVQQCGAGVDYNATFEFVIACVLAFGCSLNLASSNAWRFQLWSLFLLLAFSNRLEPFQFLSSSKYREEVQAQALIFTSEVARVQAIQGRVTCDVLLVCFRAGKAFEYDDFAMDQRVATGAWDSSTVKREIESRNLQFQHIDERSIWNGKTFNAALKGIF